MADNKSVLEQALLEAQQLEEAVKSNAKGILAATMKQEIEELVKESLTEQLEDEDDFVVDDEEVEFAGGEDFDDEEYEDLEDEVNVSELPDEEEAMVSIDVDADEPLDLTAASDEEVLKVFKAMGSEDGIVVTQDGETIDIEDQEAGTEYKIELAENKLNSFRGLINEGSYKSDEKHESVIDDESDDEIKEGMKKDMYELNTKDEPMYEIELGEEEEVEADATVEELDEYDEGYNARLDSSLGVTDGKESTKTQSYASRRRESEGMEKYFHKPKFSSNKHSEQDMAEGGMYRGDQGGVDYPHFHNTDPGYKPKKGGDIHGDEGGVDFGSKGLSQQTRHHHNEAYDEETHEGHGEGHDEEMREASRTYGFGSKSGRGLRKAISNNRNYEYPMNESTKKHVNNIIRTAKQLQEENQAYREKNKEYRQALKLFREKLNEVAVFNANLAYSTKLFTENTTTKKEKINILRRFDNVKTLNESKNLFSNIKEELGSKVNKLNESVQKTITKTPSGGSSINLIETKTYENPQIARMKDIMSKL